MSARVDTPAILSPRALKRSAAKVRREVRQGWTEGGTHILTADDALRRAGVEIREELRWFRDDKSRRQAHRVLRAVLPVGWPRQEGGFLELVQDLANPGTPEPPVIEAQLRDGREIHMYGLGPRVLHRAIADELMVALKREGFFAASSHGYMPRRGRFTALEAARAAQRSAQFWVSSFDVERCFGSIRTSLLEWTMDEHCPFIEARLKRLILRAFAAPRLRRPSHPARSSQPHSSPHAASLDRVMVGSALGPLACNLVLTLLVDRVLEREFGDRLTVARYADDIVVLATSAGEAQAARAVVEASLASIPPALGSLRLHPHKGTPEPIDLRNAPLRWLGMLLHGKRIGVPREKRQLWLTRLNRVEDEWFKSFAHNAVSELRYLSSKQRSLFLRDLKRGAGVRRAATLETVWKKAGILGQGDTGPAHWRLPPPHEVHS